MEVFKALRASLSIINYHLHFSFIICHLSFVICHLARLWRAQLYFIYIHISVHHGIYC
jgi:hypothetical protein